MLWRKKSQPSWWYKINVSLRESVALKHIPWNDNFSPQMTIGCPRRHTSIRISPRVVTPLLAVWEFEKLTTVVVAISNWQSAVYFKGYTCTSNQFKSVYIHKYSTPITSVNGCLTEYYLCMWWCRYKNILVEIWKNHNKNK